ncbi:MAG TPA: ABC transporter substrate-binding protein [Burkholderiales bacterium]|nr:ABC transporter substrate-binding protein [Burkholderiales bacterium]
MRSLLSAAALAAVIATPAFAQARIVITIGGSDKIVYLPAKLAERLGYFQAQGVDVELRSEAAGVEARDALLSGAVQGVVGFYDHTIALQAKGKLVQSVVQFTVAPGEALLASARSAAHLRSPADLRGRVVGVTGLGSSTSFLTNYLALSHGVKPNELSLVPAGAGNRFIAAMREGTIEAGMTTEPTVSRLLKGGEAHLLVDLRTPESTTKALGGLYPSACLYLNSAWAERNRPQVQRMVNALVNALAYIHSRSAEEIAAAMPPEYYAGDRALYVRAIDAAKPMFTLDGRMPQSGPATVLKVMSAIDRNVQFKNIDLAKTFTGEFVGAARVDPRPMAAAAGR